MDDQTAGGAGGPEPPPEPPRADPIAGELVTETLDYDGGRRVTVYVPPDPPGLRRGRSWCCHGAPFRAAPTEAHIPDQPALASNVGPRCLGERY